MVQPLIIPRAEHALSRRLIDPDALKVMYRLHKANHAAYLVGGGVRDLLLGRHPKDFDLGTSAHPHEVKRLFRNCWIIGRRFRLAHVKFGQKTIEVATFRRQLPPEELPPEAPVAELAAAVTTEEPRPAPAGVPHRRIVRRDNSFGTPEEDAFRRDFTVNALFYDIGTLSIIDYVGGLEDLRAGVVRSIGNPNERFVEDPVRMLRAIALAARLDFAIDPPILDAIARHREEIGHASPARMIEEIYKILRSGAATQTMRRLAEVGVLEHIAPQVARRQTPELWESLSKLDAYRARFDAAPAALTNAILLGSLVTPVLPIGPLRRHDPDEPRPRETGVVLGVLPIARRDVERLRQILMLQARLLQANLPVRVQRSLVHRNVFNDALTWLDVHAGAPAIVDQWREVAAGRIPADDETEAAAPHRRRRRRRRRRRFDRGEREPL